MYLKKEMWHLRSQMRVMGHCYHSLKQERKRPYLPFPQNDFAFRNILNILFNWMIIALARNSNRDCGATLISHLP